MIKMAAATTNALTIRNTPYHGCGMILAYVASIGRSGNMNIITVDRVLFTKWIAMVLQILWVLKYTQPMNRPRANAAIPCWRLPCNRANMKAEKTIANHGLLWVSKPRQMIPRQSNSSQSGARIETDRIISTGRDVSNIRSKASFMTSDIGNIEVTGSTRAPRKGVATITNKNSGSIDRKLPLRGSSTGTKP